MKPRPTARRKATRTFQRATRSLRGLWRLATRERRMRHHAVGWLRSVWCPGSPLRDEMPWLTYAATEWLQRHLDEQMSVFEFGSGGSTIFFARRVREVISVEHDPVWYRRVTDALETCGIRNHRYLLETSPPRRVPTAGERPDTRVSGPAFDRYVQTIDAFPEESFDVILVDGMARLECLRRARSKVKHNGFLLLDNSDRLDYAPGRAGLADQRVFDFFGLGPYGEKPWQTTAWQITQPSRISRALEPCRQTCQPTACGQARDV